MPKLFTSVVWPTLDALNAEGVVCVPSVLRSKLRKELLSELARCPWEPAQAEVGTHRVRQRFLRTEHFLQGSAVYRVRDALQASLSEWYGAMTPCPFSQPLQFNDVVAQRYDPAMLEAGITAHRDNLRFVNLVVVLVLSGSARFCVCDDHSGKRPRAVRNEPGDVLLMRGAEFDDWDYRPFHFVDLVTSPRTTLALRHDTKLAA